MTGVRTLDRMHIGEAAHRSGLSIDTVRYYESLGLAANGGRDPAGRRVYGDDDVRWLVFLRRMRETGLPVADLREYVAHRAAGAAGVPGVLEVLRRHLRAMAARRAALDACTEAVEAKIAKYERLGAAGTAPGSPEVDLV